MGVRKYQNFEVRGVVYRDVACAAWALDVEPDTVRRALRLGREDRLGLNQPGHVPCPVRIAGKVYPSAHAAAAAFGKTPDAVWKAVNDGDPDRIAGTCRYGSWRAKPVSIGPLSFRSMRAASVALGMHPDRVSRVLRSGSERGKEALIAAAMRLALAEGMRRRSPGEDAPGDVRPAETAA